MKLDYNHFSKTIEGNIHKLYKTIDILYNQLIMSIIETYTGHNFQISLYLF